MSKPLFICHFIYNIHVEHLVASQIADPGVVSSILARPHLVDIHHEKVFKVIILLVIQNVFLHLRRKLCALSTGYQLIV